MPSGTVRRRRAQLWLGTLVDIAAEGRSEVEVERAIEAAFDEIAGIHHAMSAHRGDSELTRVNQHAARATQPISSCFRAVLSCALDVAARSHGAFDPTAGAMLGELGYVPRHARHTPGTTWRDVHLGVDGVHFRRPLQLDFGGIAKGYAVDRAISALRQRSMLSACVNAGGDLRVFGARSEIVHVHTHGLRSTVLPLVEISDGAVASSGYTRQRQRIGERWTTPLIDVAQGISRLSMRTVSVVAPQCMIADALTKVVALRGRASATLLQHYRAAATILTPEKDAWRRTEVGAPDEAATFAYDAATATA